MESLEAAISERIEMIYRGEVPEGYKKTKVGIIPEDWEVKRLGELGEFFRGKGIPKAKIITEGIGCITYGEIYTTYNYTFKNFMSYTDEKTAQNSVSIKKNDILFAGSGETLEEIGKCVAYLGEDEAYAGGDIVVFRPYNIDGEVLGYLLNHNIVNSQKYKLGQGHSVVHIYAKGLETILIPVLQEKEQQKIAQILSTWDEAIELKEKLIEEKKEQKKGLMQKLLTGEVRLPGFDGEWEEVRLGEVLIFPKKEAVQYPQEYYLLTVKLHLNGVEATDKKPNKTKRSRPYYIRKPKELLIGRQNFHNGGIGIVPDEMENYIASNAISSLNAKKGDIKFYYFYLSNANFYKKIGHIIGGTGQKEISETELKKLKLTIPKSIQEQKAIAQILSTSDKEIELLEEELELLKLQKKGLMQLLLTGMIRVKCYKR